MTNTALTHGPHNDQLPAALVTQRGAPRAEQCDQPAAPCGDRLVPIPMDSEHDGWSCIASAGHPPHTAHVAVDGTTW